MIYSSNTFYIFVLYVLPRRKMMGKSKNYLRPTEILNKRMRNAEKIALKNVGR